VTVDPGSAATIYAAGSGGLYKTQTGGSTWTSVLSTTDSVIGLAVSPADHRLVFVATAQGTGSFQVRRSVDGGAAWTTIEGRRTARCLYLDRADHPRAPPDQRQLRLPYLGLLRRPQRPFWRQSSAVHRPGRHLGDTCFTRHRFSRRAWLAEPALARHATTWAHTSGLRQAAESCFEAATTRQRGRRS
jgi:hypothetical protein